MKRILVIALALIMTFAFTIPFVSAQEAPDPPESISVYGLDKLEEMRGMLAKSDEELNPYLHTIPGGGLESREDLVNFLALIDSIPVLKFIDGEISWICLYPDSDVLYISTKAANGDWVRLEYFLSMDPSEGLEKFTSDKSTLSQPVQSQDGRVTVYSQVKEPHSSGTGEMIKWALTLDDIFVYTVYYVKSVDGIEAEDVFANVQIINIPDLSDKSALGDLNGNGKIDSMDYVLLKRTYFGTYSLADEAVGDVNGNETIDSMDYVLLKRAYFGTYAF